MLLKIDTHTHTIASTHAYSTIAENAVVAGAAGLTAIGITDHAPPITDSPNILHFMNLHVIDREIAGVYILRAAELNICDFDGGIGVEDSVLSKLDYAIASFHSVLLTPGSKLQNTRAYLAAMNNPYVKIIGHPDDGSVPVDFEQLVLAAKHSNTLLELNNSSLKAAYYRLNTRKNLVEMLRLCEKHGVEISVGTDSHFASAVGRFDESLTLLDEMRFPQELLANTSLERFNELIERKVI